MIKSYIKYLTLFLIIFLLNSNFSYAISEMMCNMSDVPAKCECETGSQTGKMNFSSEEKACCKIRINEINNSNTLEKNKTNISIELQFQQVVYFMPVIEFSRNYTIQRIFALSKMPIPDIPVLNSSFLI